MPRPGIALLRQLLAAALVSGLMALSLGYAPTLFLPKRWLDIEPGLPRTQVHAVLGVPDIRFDDKGFDGWHNPFGIGASVLIVTYDAALARVATARIKTVWGYAHQSWVQEYKAVLKNSP